MLSLTNDLNNSLLLYLDYSALNSMRLVNLNYHNILNKSSFWNNKLRYDYKDFVVPTKIRDAFQKCLELYKQLIKNDDIKLLGFVETNEYFEVAGWMSKMKKSIFTSGCNLLAKYGQLDILQNHLRFASPDENGLMAAILNKQYQTAEFITEKWKLTPNIGNIIETGDLPFLKKCYQKYKFKFTQNDINHAIICGQIEIVKWFARYKCLPNQYGLNQSTKYNRLEILKWLSEEHNLIPTEADTALIHQQYQIVDWLKTLEIEPTNKSMSALVYRNELETLKEFLINNIVPDNESIRCVIRERKITIMEMFLQYNCKPNGGAIDIAIVNHDFSMLRLLEKYGIIPDNKSANKAVEKEFIDILNWLLIYDILPTVEAADNAARDGKLNVLVWMAKYHILPTSYEMKFAALHGHLDILLWGTKHNIIPSEDIYDHIFLYSAASDGIPFFEENLTMEENLMKTEASRELYLNIIKFLFEHGVLPNQNDINDVVYFQSIQLLTLFLQYDLFPEKDKIDKTKITNLEFITFLKEYDLY